MPLRTLLAGFAATVLAGTEATVSQSEPTKCAAESALQDDAVAMMQVSMHSKRRGQEGRSSASARSQLLRAAYGDGSLARSDSQVARGMDALVKMHADRPVHLLKLVKKALEVQKETISALGETDQAKVRQAQEHRRAFVQQATEQQKKAQKGELPSDPICKEDMSEAITAAQTGVASMAMAHASAATSAAVETSSKAKTAADASEATIGTNSLTVTTATNMTSWGSDNHESQHKQYPFEYLLDVDYIYQSNDYLETYMNQKYGTIPIRGWNEPLYSMPKKANVVHEKAPTVPPPVKPATPAPTNAPAPALLFKAECYTHVDQRAYALQGLPWTSKVAKAGTSCRFGVTPGDEGSHCVHDLSYGSFGWCYTKTDQSEWGSCSEDCPVEGPAKLLTSRIDNLTGKITSVLKKLRQEHCK